MVGVSFMGLFRNSFKNRLYQAPKNISPPVYKPTQNG